MTASRVASRNIEGDSVSRVNKIIMHQVFALSAFFIIKTLLEFTGKALTILVNLLKFGLSMNLTCHLTVTFFLTVGKTAWKW